MCCLNGCQGQRAWGCVCSDPSSHPDSIHHPAWRVWEKGGGRRGETKWKRERLLLWLQRQQSLSHSIMGVQGPPMSGKQRPEAPLCLTHTHSWTSFWGRHRNKKEIVGRLSALQEDGEGGKKKREANLWTNNATVCMCGITRLHACMHTDTHNGSILTVVGTITVNTDGRRGK